MKKVAVIPAVVLAALCTFTGCKKEEVEKVIAPSFPKWVCEDTVNTDTGNRHTVLETFFFSGTHIGKLETVSGKLTECPDISRWNKRCLNNIKTEKICNPFCVTFIRFLPFMALTYLGCVRTTCICVSRMLKTGIQYLPVDSIQTSWQLYERSQSRIAAICELLVEKDFTL